MNKGTHPMNPCRGRLGRISARSIARSETGKLHARRAIMAVGVVLLSFSGCRSPGPVFPIYGTGGTMVWPADGRTPRIRYVGELRAAADLRPVVPLYRRAVGLLLGRSPAMPLYTPRDVLAAPNGRLWVADPGGRCVHLFDLERRVYKKIDTIGGEPLRSPVGLALGPNGTLFVCDSEAGVIHRLQSTSLASLPPIHAPEALLRPTAAVWVPDPGELYVVDTGTHDIKVFGREGQLERILGTRGSGVGELNFPVDIAWDGKLLWIVDAGNGRVQGFTRTLEPVASVGMLGDAPGYLALPKSAAFDSQGHLYVVDSRFENVQLFNREGQLLLFFGGEGWGPGRFSLPAGISIDADDRIWVCDAYNSRIQVFDYLKARTDNE